MTYGAFLDRLDAGNVASVTFVGTDIEGQLRHPIAGARDAAAGPAFGSRVPDFGDPALIAELRRHHVAIAAATPSPWAWLLARVPLPMLLFLAAMVIAAFVRVVCGARGAAIARPERPTLGWRRFFCGSVKPLMSPEILAELAPTGVLRAGINLSNFLLVTGRSAAGEPVGVSPDMAGEIARRLGVQVKYVPFKSPGELADKAGEGVWDIGLIGAEPERAETIAFTAAYAEIEATYLVPAGSGLAAIAAVDAPGVRISVTGRSAYGLWLDRNISHATLVRSESLESAYEAFVREKLEVLAGLRPRLLADLERLPGARILEGKFTAVQQAVGTARKNLAGAAFLAGFVEEAKASGLVARLIAQHKVRGLSVAPAS